MNTYNLPRLIMTAKGEQKAEIVLKNARVVDVFCHCIRECDVAICDGIIAGLGKYDGFCEVDLHGNYVMPSFVDGHAHIESSMLTPAEYAKAVVPKGVTSMIADPHEIVNVCGEDGLAFMIDSSKELPMDIHYMLPSCIPATPFDSSGCVINGDESKRLFEEYDCFGLGEMMNFPGVLACNEDIIKKLSCSDIIDGHAPSVRGKDLCAYTACGIKTDHECVTAEEVLEKVGMGMYVLIREGSSARNLEALFSAINPYTLRRLLFCTDDKHLDDILEQGTISHCINKAIELGADPIDAITMATLNSCECYGLSKQGAIAPGYKADLLVCGDLSARNILQVYKSGKLVAKDGEALFDTPAVDSSKVIGTLNLRPLILNDLQLKFDPASTVIEVFPHTLYTAGIHCSSAEGLNMAAVIERHKATGNIGKAFVKGLCIKGGAVAQSIGHDSHNICVVGDNEYDMLKAVDALGTQGGISVIKDGELVSVFKLPIAGIMTDKPASDALAEYNAVCDGLSQLCENDDNSLFMLMSFMSLLVIPDVKLSDKGLFDVCKWQFIK
ncbi:MAG: adenine deaminase [Oscillospiraceae bacterium]